MAPTVLRNREEALQLFEKLLPNTWDKMGNRPGIESRFGPNDDFRVQLYREGHLGDGGSEGRGYSSILAYHYAPSGTNIEVNLGAICDGPAHRLYEDVVPAMLKTIFEREQSEDRGAELLYQQRQSLGRDPQGLRAIIEDLL